MHLFCTLAPSYVRRRRLECERLEHPDCRPTPSSAVRCRPNRRFACPGTGNQSMDPQKHFYESDIEEHRKGRAMKKEEMDSPSSAPPPPAYPAGRTGSRWFASVHSIPSAFHPRNARLPISAFVLLSPSTSPLPSSPSSLSFPRHLQSRHHAAPPCPLWPTAPPPCPTLSAQTHLQNLQLPQPPLHHVLPLPLIGFRMMLPKSVFRSPAGVFSEIVGGELGRLADEGSVLLGGG